MNFTTDLLRIMGSPFQDVLIPIDKSEIEPLCKYSAKNRMFFYFMDRIGQGNLQNLAYLYQKELTKCNQTYDAITGTSAILRDANIKHGVIKTIRPYKSTTVDIDIVIFGPEVEYEKTIVTLLNAKFGMLGRGPQSTTLQHPTVDIKVDIYNEIAVSHIVYLDKRELVGFKATKQLPNGRFVDVLTPEADLATIIAHSIIKEHMYTLSEYFTFIHYLKQIDVGKFLELVAKSNITIPVRTHATITALLHKEAFKVVPAQLMKMLDFLGEETLENTRTVKSDLKMPHKYHPLTVIRSLTEIAKGKKSRDSMALQMTRMLRPSFTKEFTRMFFEHLIRETY